MDEQKIEGRVWDVKAAPAYKHASYIMNSYSKSRVPHSLKQHKINNCLLQILANSFFTRSAELMSLLQLDCLLG